MGTGKTPRPSSSSGPPPPPPPPPLSPLGSSEEATGYGAGIETEEWEEEEKISLAGRWSGRETEEVGDGPRPGGEGEGSSR